MKYFVQKDGQRSPGDSVGVNCAENDCLDQYRDLKTFFRECLGQELLSLFISYPDMNFFYPNHSIQIRQFKSDNSNQS